MSGRLLRLFGTATVTVLTAGALLTAAPAPLVAAAEPPGERPVADLLTDLRRLHHETVRATEAYTATDRELTKQRAVVADLDRRLVTARLSLHDSRGAAGRLARQQYQNSSTALSPYVRLLMTDDPHRALEQSHVIGQVARDRADTVERLVGDEQDTDALARRARVALDRQLTLAERHRREHDTARDRLSEIERLLASLTPEQLAGIRKSEGNRAYAPATSAR
ncbi:coiled-coil domain-containing protein [Streptomyces sp. NPDC002324]